MHTTQQPQCTSSALLYPTVIQPERGLVFFLRSCRRRSLMAMARPLGSACNSSPGPGGEMRQTPPPPTHSPRFMRPLKGQRHKCWHARPPLRQSCPSRLAASDDAPRRAAGGGIMAVVAAAAWRRSGGQCVSHTLDPGQLLRSCCLPPRRRMVHFSVRFSVSLRACLTTRTTFKSGAQDSVTEVQAEGRRRSFIFSLCKKRFR